MENFVAWYYTPMALRFSDHLTPEATVYDCMDELSAFDGAPPELIQEEQRLFERADVVFAGGASLYASKRKQHANVHLYPSSIDRHHFATGRLEQDDPEDQVSIPRPRIGFFGVLDERLDRALLRKAAEEHPEWHFVLLGPVVKISEDDLPRGYNLHYLGQKSYADLPKYLANWDVAMLPFAQNAATAFISPTKTPEYLAAGKPVVSTPIRDVVRPYGEMGLVKIAADAQEFGKAIESCLRARDERWLDKVDRFLSSTSWDKTFEGMWKEIQRCLPQDAGSSAAYNAEKRSGSNV
jgi:UDP-galactopyranose mutase